MIISVIGFVLLLNLNFFVQINTEDVSLCEKLHEMQVNETNSEMKLERIRAFCEAAYASKNEHQTDLIADFDLTQIDSGKIQVHEVDFIRRKNETKKNIFVENDANQILRRFRRGRGGGGGGARGGGGGRFGGSRFGGSRSGGSSRFSGGRFRSSSSGGSRIFSRNTQIIFSY